MKKNPVINFILLLKLLFFLFAIALNSTGIAATDDYNAGIRYLHVQKGQTLHNIVKRLYPTRHGEWPKITKEIVRLNPQAFINDDPTRMKAGVRLSLPGADKKKSTATVKPVKKVGFVQTVSGSVIAVDKSKVSRKLLVGHPIYLGDKVITGEDGLVRLKMIDDAILDLRCYSIMVIEDYAVNPDNRRSILNLLQGSLRKVTGKIGKMSEDVYELRTPVASVGVRGTEYALRVFQSKGCGGTIDADDGLYLEVIKGLVDVHNAAGSVVVNVGETTYVPLPKTAPKKTDVKAGVLHPVQPTVQPETEADDSYWWWLLGIVAVALLL